MSSNLDKEKQVLDKLVEAWNMFLELESQHPDELNDFKDGIHKCQSVIGLRFAREYRPDVFPKKVKEEKKICDDEHLFTHIEIKEWYGRIVSIETCSKCRYSKPPKIVYQPEPYRFE